MYLLDYHRLCPSGLDSPIMVVPLALMYLLRCPAPLFRRCARPVNLLNLTSKHETSVTLLDLKIQPPLILQCRSTFSDLPVYLIPS